MSDEIKVEFSVHFRSGQHGKRELRNGEKPLTAREALNHETPRISKLMALAIRFDELVRTGEVEDFAEIAALAHVTRARVSQIVNLLNLAPDIQEDLLKLDSRLTPVASERDIRSIATEMNWCLQRRMWKEKQACGS